MSTRFSSRGLVDAQRRWAGSHAIRSSPSSLRKSLHGTSETHCSVLKPGATPPKMRQIVVELNGRSSRPIVPFSPKRDFSLDHGRLRGRSTTYAHSLSPVFCPRRAVSYSPLPHNTRILRPEQDTKLRDALTQRLFATSSNAVQLHSVQFTCSHIDPFSPFYYRPLRAPCMRPAYPLPTRRSLGSHLVPLPPPPRSRNCCLCLQADSTTAP
jgi:hypothetical protein